MRIWLIGAGERAIEALRQLQKNENLAVVVSHPEANAPAVTQGVIAKIDLVETVTSVNINLLGRRIRPDLILIDAAADPRNVVRLTGGSAFADALINEIAQASDYPCIVL
jgi:hypothetical protein